MNNTAPSFVDTLLNQKPGSVHLTRFTEYDTDLILQTVCAYLNHEGGWIIVDTDSLFADVQGKISELQSKVTSLIRPLPLVYIHEEYDNGHRVILLTVMKGGLPPYSYKSNYYIEKNNKIMAPGKDDINLLLRQSFPVSTWELSTHLLAEWDDLDESLMQSVLEKGWEKGRVDRSCKSPEELLGNLNLKDITYIKNGAVALFAHDISHLLPQCKLRIQVMLGGKASESFQDVCFLEDNLFALSQRVHDYFLNRLPMVSSFSKEEWDSSNQHVYPLDVVDEAVTNALIHRDFSSVVDEVLINIYSDRMEIINPGEMPKDIVKKKSIILPHISTPRNPLMAEIFYVGDKMEKTGRGMKLIHDRMKELNRRLPEWECKKGYTQLTLFRSIKITKLNSRVTQFIDTLSVGDRFTKKEYMNYWHYELSEATAKNDLAQMVDQGVLMKEGRGPSTSYVVLAQN